MNNYVVDCNVLRKNYRIRSEVDVYVVLESDFDAMEKERDDAISQLAALREELHSLGDYNYKLNAQYERMCGSHLSIEQRLADAERRNAELSRLLNLADHYLQDQFFNSVGEIVEPNSDDREEIRATIRAALNKPEEAKS